MEEKTLRPCHVKENKAFFHKWSDVSMILPPSNLIGGHTGGQISETFGIVEYEDGKVELVRPGLIRFDDNPMDYVKKD